MQCYETTTRHLPYSSRPSRDQTTPRLSSPVRKSHALISSPNNLRPLLPWSRFPPTLVFSKSSRRYRFSQHVQTVSIYSLSLSPPSPFSLSRSLALSHYTCPKHFFVQSFPIPLCDLPTSRIHLSSPVAANFDFIFSETRIHTPSLTTVVFFVPLTARFHRTTLLPFRPAFDHRFTEYDSLRFVLRIHSEYLTFFTVLARRTSESYITTAPVVAYIGFNLEITHFQSVYF